MHANVTLEILRGAPVMLERDSPVGMLTTDEFPFPNSIVSFSVWLCFHNFQENFNFTFAASVSSSQ